VDIPQIAKKLNVQYVLEGSVRKVADKVRINAQLIDASSGHHLWAERYDGKFGDVFNLQDKIVRKIVVALAVKLTDDEEENITRKETDIDAAYHAFLKGLDTLNRYNPKTIAKGFSYFERAIKLDPNYWRAYAALGESYFKLSNQAPSLLNISFPEARLRARHFMNMSMRQPSTLSYRTASMLSIYKREFENAITESERALTLEPNNSRTNGLVSFALIAGSRPTEAIAYAQRAYRIDPGCFW